MADDLIKVPEDFTDLPPLSEEASKRLQTFTTRTEHACGSRWSGHFVTPSMIAHEISRLEACAQEAIRWLPITDGPNKWAKIIKVELERAKQRILSEASKSDSPLLQPRAQTGTGRDRSRSRSRERDSAAAAPPQADPAPESRDLARGDPAPTQEVSE